MLTARKALIILLIVPLLISCSSKNYFVNPEYKNKKIVGANLVIPTVSDVNFYQSSSVFDESEIEKIKKEFSSLLSGTLRNDLRSTSSFSDIKYASFRMQPVLESKTFDLNEKEKIIFNLPKNQIETDIAENLFFLFLEDLSLSIVNKESDTSDPAKHYSAKPTSNNESILTPRRFNNLVLILDLKYCLFDNIKGKAVSFGRFSAEQIFTENSSAEKIINAHIIKFAEKVFENTPFENN
jgi:hypothetical protein